ncbi:MAG: nuclease-related domain-containing protein, partial [Anaerotignaceae bacterium]
MGIFDKIKEPIFIKDDSTAVNQLKELKKLRNIVTEDLSEKLEEEIRNVEYGIAGEKTVRYELENSHMPMFVLHDLYFEHKGLTAQIDYLIITRKYNFVVECKNLYGDIEINNKGDFIRTINYGKGVIKEGIYSPITQNRRHLELLKEIRKGAKNNFISKLFFEKHFYSNYRSVVVLSNPKTILRDNYARNEINEQVIKADQLVEYIRKINSDPKKELISEKAMEDLAYFFLDRHKEEAVDYVEKLKKDLKIPIVKKTKMPSKKKSKEPICNKCGANMVK